jgi:hypothetical protein
VRTHAGTSLVETLVVLALALMALAAVAPAAAYLRGEGRAAAGARHLAGRLAAARFKAVATRRGRGLFFEPAGGGWVWWDVEDGNGNGLRVAEIRRAVDRVVAGPHRLEHEVHGAFLGFPPRAAVPRIPPASGALTPPFDPVRFGGASLVAFSPTGAASSGTLYVTDGERGLFGVVLFGPTARLRVWRFDAGARRWTL